MHSSVGQVVRAVARQWKVPGSNPGVDMGIFDFWRTGRPACSENGFKTKNIFFLKIRFFFLKMKFRDINRYAQIYTDVSKYAQIQA
jgi:hypothetical protein